MDLDQYIREVANRDPAEVTEEERADLAAKWKSHMGEVVVGQAEADIAALVDRYSAGCPHNPDIKATLQGLARRAVSENWSPEITEVEFIRARRPSVGLFNVGTPAMNDMQANHVQEVAILASVGIPQKQLAGWYGDQVVDRATAPDVRGTSLHSIMRACIRAAGGTPPEGRFTDGSIRAALMADAQLNIKASGSGFSTQGAGLSGILSAVVNKLLLQGWESVGTTWSKWCRQGTDISDFKQATRYRMTGIGTFQVIPPGGEFRHVEMDAESYTNQLSTAGAMIAITRQDWINDDLGALAAVPRKLGRMAAIYVEKAVYKSLLTNAATIFTSGHKNLIASGAGSVLQDSSLATAFQKFREQTDLNGDPLFVEPPFVLLVPPALEETALKLAQSVAFVGTTSTDKPLPTGNVWQGKFDVVVAPYLSVADQQTGTTGSDVAWYLMLPPSDFSCIEVAFLNGQSTPTVENGQADFNLLGYQWRAYYDVGVSGQAEYRGGVKSPGA